MTTFSISSVRAILDRLVDGTLQSDKQLVATGKAAMLFSEEDQNVIEDTK